MKTLATRPATETKEIFERKLKDYSNYEKYLKKLNDAGMTFEILIDDKRNEVYTEINGIYHFAIIFDDFDSLDCYAYATIRTLAMTNEIARDIIYNRK